MQHLIEKANVLIEALPYIQRFRGEIIVVKLGGSAMEERRHHDSILTDIAFMECVGMRTVVMHGGGKAISRAMTAAGLTPHFVKGLRVTDAAAIQVVKDVIANRVNTGIVETLTSRGARARRVDGEAVFRVARRTGRDEATGELLDWGFVGEVRDVLTAPLLECLQDGALPVVTPLGLGVEDGATYNLNADDAAAALARALKARKLAFLSDVPGLLRDRNDESSLIPSVRVHEVEDLVNRGVIDGGMLPKIRSCMEALAAGVRKIHIIDGRLPHSLLLEIFTNEGVGTEITA
jgi:acetylglutamate kinase